MTHSRQRRPGQLPLLAAALLLAACSETPAPGAAEDAAPSAQEPVAERVTMQLDDLTAGWIDTGLQVTAGDQIAVFANGTADLQGLVLEPRHLLWWRILPWPRTENGQLRNV